MTISSENRIVRAFPVHLVPAVFVYSLTGFKFLTGAPSLQEAKGAEEVS